jgi:hypothetical protein
VDIRNCHFINNSAELYGNTFAALAKSMLWVTPLKKQVIIIESGDTLATFSATFCDAFNQRIVSIDFWTDFVYLAITVKDLNQSRSGLTPSHNARVVTGFEKPVFQPATEAVFAESEVVGYEGDYELVIYPVINYDVEKFNLSARVVIKPCEEPRILHSFPLEHYPRCVKRNVCCLEMVFLFEVLTLSFFSSNSRV